MNDISRQLLEAMEIIADEKISKLKYDKTLQGQIYSIVNPDTGEYKVRYNSNIFSAFANDVTKRYKVEDKVYINVPEGNFSAKKIILSKVDAQSLTQNQLAALKNSIYEISPSLEIAYGVNFNSPVGVIAGAPLEDPNSQVYVCEELPNEASPLFLQYSNNYEYVRIKGSFKTQFHNKHDQGNYGIEVQFYANDGTIVPYRLQLENFVGDPYSLSVYSEQQIVLRVQKGYLKGLKSIKLFEENFLYDKYITYKDREPIVNENRTEPNIFVKDVSVQYVELKDLSDSDYYLMISPIKGNVLNNRITSLTFLGRLIYQGSDIIGQVDSCQWYTRDLSVMIGHEAYNKDAGVGWRKIEGAASPRLDIAYEEVRKQKQYKLVVTYQDVILSAEMEAFNANNLVEYYLEQVAADNNETVALRISNSALVGNWYVLYPDGAYQAVENGTGVNSINISPYARYSTLIFYVEVMDADGILGVLSYQLSNTRSQEEITIFYTGEDTYLYDANGDITIEDSERERTLQAAIEWRQGSVMAYSLSWSMADGTEIPKNKLDAFTPENSMLENLWVDSYNILHYNLKQKYKITSNNNTVGIKIQTYADNNKVYYFEKEILCLKDGDQGTNGTTYVAAVRPCDANGVKLAGFQALRYNGGWLENMLLRCYVYKDGELINSNSDYDITYKWAGCNVSIGEYTELYEQISITGTSSIGPNTSVNNLTFYVKTQVDIEDKKKNKSVTIYTSYPIDVLVGNAYKSDIDISNIPSYIKYTSSGIEPLYYNDKLSFVYKDITYSNIISLNEKLLTIDQDGYLNPTTNFTYENINTSESNIGVLKLPLSGNEYVLHPVIMYLNTYGNEAINGWDGTALYTDNNQYIFAPQVGAGEKDRANRFTGVVMGKDSGLNLIGLFGYQSGVNTFGLQQDGRAFFGAKIGGGQIRIDGYSGVISGGDVTVSGSGSITPAANGMYLRLSDKKISGSTKAIGIGYGTHKNTSGTTIREEKFYVTYDGKLKATGADIQGKIYALEGQIGGTERSGGWTIRANRLYSGSGSTRVELNSDSNETYAIWAGSTSSSSAMRNKFAVSKTGLLYAKEGNIGGWELKKTYLQATSGTVGMASTGNAAFWAGSGLSSSSSSIDAGSSAKFLVTRDGQLYCASAQVRGDITADSLFCENGEIGGWIIEKGKLSAYNGSVQLLSNDPNGVAIRTDYGDIGLIKGQSGSGTTYNFGMDGNGSVIIKGNNNVALRGTNVYLDGDTITATADPERQFGIYARFG